MKYLNIIFLLIVMISLAICCQKDFNDNKNNQERKETGFQKEAPIPADLNTYEPMTQEYFDGFMNSTNEFSIIYFYYYTGLDSNHLDAEEKVFGFNIQGEQIHDGTKYRFVNKKLNEIDYYISDYTYIDINSTPNYKSYSHDLTPDLIIPLFQIIQQNGDYLFNAAEYNGAERVEYRHEMQFGYRNNVVLKIQQPDQPENNERVFKAFCKGWNPGEEPPAELMPVINYLENTIIPILLQHPEP